MEKHGLFRGKTVLMTAGPTREAIDPVRYITNHSTGKMGYAIATALLEAGANVVLVSGPVNLTLSAPGLTLIPVVTAAEMLEAAHEYFSVADIAIFSAAVADYKPDKISLEKIKKSGDKWEIILTRNEDIAMSFGEQKKTGQISVGFALETNQELQHAKEKLIQKKLDLVVLNSLNDPGAAFGYDTNKVTMIDKTGHVKTFPLKQKEKVAEDLLLELKRILEREVNLNLPNR